MPRKYSSPRYKKPTRPGRKPKQEDEKRKTISVRLAPDTYNFLQGQGQKKGLLLDRLIRGYMLRVGETFPDIEAPVWPVDEDAGVEHFDQTLENLRGILAMMVERGTTHLNKEQIDILDTSMTLLTNNYLATFKKGGKL
jgi:hypothetical protein